MKKNKNIRKWEILEEEDVSPSPWLKVFKHKVKLPDGKIIDDYYVSKFGNVAMIAAFTKKREIVFVRQYKHGVREVILELPAGRVDKKTPDIAAKVELEEETGFLVEKLEHIGDIYGEPSKDSLTIHGFLVREIKGKIEQKLDITEDIEVVLVRAREVDKWIKKEKIKAADTIAMIRLAQLKTPELFE